MLRIGLLCLLVCVFSGIAKAQSASADTTFISEVKNNVIQRYQQAGIQSNLYSGIEYVEYDSPNEEHPAFINDWIQGTLLYAGNRYKEIPMLYDLSSDKLIIDRYGRHIQLYSPHVSSFNIEGHHFVNLSENIKAGFYEVLYNGNVKVYCRREKSLQPNVMSASKGEIFIEKIIYIIFRDNQYFPVKNKKNVVAVFSDRKNEVKDFMKKHASMSDDPATALTQVTLYYEEISGKP